MRRSKEQEEANEVDLELFRCLCRAEQMGWREAAGCIRRARSDVRSRMHSVDRADTAAV